jgi:hypothetical protein
MDAFGRIVRQCKTLAEAAVLSLRMIRFEQIRTYHLDKLEQQEANRMNAQGKPPREVTRDHSKITQTAKNHSPSSWWKSRREG